MAESSRRISARPSRRDITDNDCSVWQENPTTNPRPNASGINQTISSTSQPYRTYQKNCFELFIKNLFEGINPFEQLELRIRSQEFLTNESYNDEWAIILQKIQTALDTPSTPINGDVKDAYVQYILDINQKLNRLQNRTLNPQSRGRRSQASITTTSLPPMTPVSSIPASISTPAATIAAPGIEQSSPPVARVLDFGEESPIVSERSDLSIIRQQRSLSPQSTTDPFINLITTLSTPKFNEEALQPYLTLINSKKSIDDLEKPPNSVRLAANHPIIDGIINNLYKNYRDIIGDEFYYEPNFKITTFITILEYLIATIIIMDRFFIRYDNYADKFKKGILSIINNFEHIYNDNFDYITLLKNGFRTFCILKLQKLENKINPRADTRVHWFTEDEMDRCIYLIKMQMIYDLDLIETFKNKTYKERLISLTTYDGGPNIKEDLIYTLKFILYDVDYSPYAAINPRKLKYSSNKQRPSFQKSRETMKESKMVEIDPQTILEKCKDLLLPINSYYNKYRLSIQKKCSLLFDKCLDLHNIRKTIMMKYPIRVPQSTIDIDDEDVDIRDIKRKDSLAILFNKWYQYDSRDRQEFWLRYFNVVFKGEPGIFLGPGKELIQVCLKSIQEELTDIFITEDSGSKRVTINPDFKATARFLEKANIKEWNIEIKKELLQFIGGLFTRALLLNIEIPVSLSLYTISYLYYKNNIEDDTYGFYYLIDMPDASKSNFKLLEMDPDTLEYVDLNFNDVYPLNKEDELITQHNVTKYINSVAKYVLTKPDKPEYIELLDAFSKGFLLKRKFLLDNGITVKYLDKLLNESGGAINKTTLEELIMRTLRIELSELQKPFDEATASREEKEKRNKIIAQQVQIKNWFIELLRSDGTNFPYEKLGIEKPETKELQTAFMMSNFLPKLMYFWTSSFNINLFELYTINIYESDLPNKLPTAHTCAKTIDLPSSYKSFDELFEKLATAVYNTQGFAFIGGMKNIIDKCIKKASKTNIINKDYNKAVQIGLITIIKSHKQLTKQQKKKIIHYIEKNPIHFKHSNKREINQWAKQMCKQIKVI